MLLRQTAALCMIELILTVSNQTTAKQTGSCFKKGYIQVVLYCCQMTELNLNTTLSEMARWVNIFHIAASAYSPVFVHPEVVQMSNRFWINNQKRIRKQCLQRPWKMIPNGNIQCVQGFPASVFLIGTVELLLTLSVLMLSPQWSVFQINSSLFECTHRKSISWPAGKKRIFEC